MRVEVGALGRVAAVCLALPAPLFGQGWTTFYSAYQDGNEAMRRGDPALAVKAFRRAIALAPTPAAKVKTYGLNFLTAYQPYLKLAEAALAAGDLAQAELALKDSATWALEPQDQREAILARVQHARKAAMPVVQAPVRQEAPVQSPPQMVVQKPAQVPAPTQMAAASPIQAPRALEPAPARALPMPAGKPSVPPPARTGPTPARVTMVPGEAPPGAVPAPSSAVTVAAPKATPVPAATPTLPAWGRWAGLGGLGVLLGGGALMFTRRRSLPKGTHHPTVALPGLPRATAGTGQTMPHAGLAVTDTNVERHFGPWVAKRILGTGGCGTAYFGIREDTGEEVAIKVPHRHLLQNAEFLARFHREAAMGAMLDHPGIVRILDPGPPEGEPWLIMPFIDGVTMESYLQQFSPLPIPVAIHLASDVAEAIGYAHTKGIVHRDLKPANIMVSAKGAVVMDLGIARMLDSGKHTSVYLGTPTYSAPEAMQNPSVGPPADRYALGIILFEMVAGAPPFQGDNPFKVLEAHSFEALPDLAALRPLAPPKLQRLIQRLCDKKAEERPEDGETIQILRDLKVEFPCDLS